METLKKNKIMARLWEIREDYDYRHGESEVEKAY
jgi:hypothetical protein